MGWRASARPPGKRAGGAGWTHCGRHAQGRAGGILLEASGCKEHALHLWRSMSEIGRGLRGGTGKGEGACE